MTKKTHQEREVACQKGGGEGGKGMGGGGEGRESKLSDKYETTIVHAVYSWSLLCFWPVRLVCVCVITAPHSLSQDGHISAEQINGAYVCREAILCIMCS